MTASPPDNTPIEQRLGPLAMDLLECLCEHLATTMGGPVQRCCLYPGQIVPMDACCVTGDCHENGMAAIRVVNIFPTRRFPVQTQDFTPCTGIHWAAVLELVVYRCAADMTDAGCPPPCNELQRDALIAIDDSLAMRRAIACCLGEDGVPCSDAVVPGPWAPIGPSGGCHGGQMQVTVDVGGVCCPRDTSPS